MRESNHQYLLTTGCRVIAILLLIVGGAATVHAESVYKCRDSRGSIAYQDRACADSTRQSLLEIASPPPVAPAPDYGRDTPPRASRSRSTHVSLQQSRAHAAADVSYECRAVDGEVFYRHSRCPGSITQSSQRRSAARGAASRRGSTPSSVAVSARPLTRGEACRRMASAGSIGRAGREHDETVSTYDRNAGRDPCRRS